MLGKGADNHVQFNSFRTQLVRQTSAKVGREIEDEVDAKIKALALPCDVSVRTALVYDGNLAPIVEADGYFDAIVPFRKLLGM